MTAAQRAELEQWWNVQPVVSNFPIANDGAKVLIVEFADFQCAACKHAVPRHEADPGQVPGRSERRPVRAAPLADQLAAATRRCRASTSPGIVRRRRPAYEMAKAKGTADALKDWFFINQEKLSPATVRRAAADVGKITDFDAQFPKVIQQVRTDVVDRLGARRELDAVVLHQRPADPRRRHRRAVLRGAHRAGAETSKVSRVSFILQSARAS